VVLSRLVVGLAVLPQAVILTGQADPAATQLK
jgi:hypothetical protein